MSIEETHLPEEEMHAQVSPDHEEILEEYRRRQMIEHLTGPMVSLLLHAVVVVACAILLVGREVREESAFEFNTKELDVKPLDPEKLEELDQLNEEPVDQVVPTVEKPTITPEAMNVETPDFSDAMAVTEMDLDLTALDVKMTTSPITLPGLYSNRSAKGRADALRTYGGGQGGASEKAVLKALRWLKDHQNKEQGFWFNGGSQEGEAMTGLALLAFLAHGETPASEEFGPTVQMGIQWLANYMLAKNAPGRGYSHGIATYALCEAYGLTKIPFIKPAMEKGLTIIVAGQQPGGGYDYSYAKGARWDLSVVSWQLQSMKAGYIAGANVPGIEEAMQKGIDFVKKTAYKDSKFGYGAPGNGSPGMQGAGALCLQLLGEGASREATSCVENTLAAMVPEWKKVGHDSSYCWYYITQGIFHGGKKVFDNWNPKFVAMMVQNQFDDGHWEEPLGEGKERARNLAADLSKYEPFMATALNALSLQVYYRYLPTYKEPTKIAQKQEDIFGFGDEEL